MPFLPEATGGPSRRFPSRECKHTSPGRLARYGASEWLRIGQLDFSTLPALIRDLGTCWEILVFGEFFHFSGGFFPRSGSAESWKILYGPYSRESR